MTPAICSAVSRCVPCVSVCSFEINFVFIIVSVAHGGLIAGCFCFAADRLGLRYIQCDLVVIIGVSGVWENGGEGCVVSVVRCVVSFVMYDK